MGYTIFFLFWMVAATGCSAYIGWKVKGRPVAGFLLGIFLGWLGVGITALLPRTMSKKVEKEAERQRIYLAAQQRAMGPDRDYWQAGFTRESSPYRDPAAGVQAIPPYPAPPYPPQPEPLRPPAPAPWPDGNTATFPGLPNEGRAV